jgi:hypothetical protein
MSVEMLGETCSQGWRVTVRCADGCTEFGMPEIYRADGLGAAAGRTSGDSPCSPSRGPGP